MGFGDNFDTEVSGVSNYSNAPFPPYDRDRMRLQREMEREFDHTSFTSSSEQDIRGDAFDEDTIDFKSSQRRHDILDFSPAINSRLLATEFADFSMAAPDFDRSSGIEIARGGGSARNSPKAPSMSSVNKRNTRRSYPHDLFSPSPARSSVPRRNGEKSLLDDNTETSNFGMKTSTPVRNFHSSGRRVSAGVPKTTENVSSAEKKRTTTSLRSKANNVQDAPTDTDMKATERLKSPKAKKADTAIPTKFQSTEAFLGELGMSTPTETITVTEKPRPQTTEPTNQSFLVPAMSDISELIGDTTRQPSAFRRRGTPGAAARSSPQHIPIQSIPIPQEERATLQGMKELQEKVQRLEEYCAQLKSDREHYEKSYLEINHHYRSLKQELDNEREKVAQYEIQLSEYATKDLHQDLPPQHSAGDTLGASEKSVLENKISELRLRVDELTRQLENKTHALRNVEGELHQTKSLLASANAEKDDLRGSAESYKAEIGRLCAERLQTSKRFEQEREQASQREQVLLQQLSSAKSALDDIQKQLQMARSMRRSENTQTVHEVSVDRQIFREMLLEELSKIKPDLFSHTTSRTTESSINNSTTTQTTAEKQAQYGSQTKFSAIKRFMPESVDDITLSQDELVKLISNMRVVGQSAEKKLAEKIVAENARKEAEAKEAEERARRERAEAEERARRERAEAEERARLQREAEELARRRIEEEEARARKEEAERKAREQAEAFAAFQQHLANFVAGHNGSTQSTTRTTTQTSHQTQTQTQTQSSSSAASSSAETVKASSDGKKKKRRVKKVVYYEEGDTTELPPDSFIVSDAEYRRITSSSSRTQESKIEEVNSKTTKDSDAASSAGTLVNEEQMSPVPQPAVFPGLESLTSKDGFAAIKSTIAAIASHDARNCTYCLRHGSETPPLPQTVQTLLIRLLSTEPSPAPELNMRPSQALDLREVIRQLTDEYKHVEMAYRTCLTQFKKKTDNGENADRAELNSILVELDWRTNVLNSLKGLVEELEGKKGGVTA